MLRLFRSHSCPALTIAAGLSLTMFAPSVSAGDHGHGTKYQIVQGYILQTTAASPASQPAQPMHASGQTVSTPAPAAASPVPLSVSSAPAQIHWVATPVSAIQVVPVQMVHVAAAPVVQAVSVQQTAVATPVQLLLPTKHRWFAHWGW